MRKDDPLLEIYSPELVTAQQEYLSALENFERLKDSPLKSARRGATDLLSAARERLLLWDITQEQIERLAKTRKVQKTLTLYSPADGVVSEKMVFEGDKVSPGMRLFQIADLSTVWALARIYEYELPFVSVGQEVEMSLPYLPGRTFKGRISFIYPYLDSKNRDVEIRVRVPNPDLFLKPNMYANITIRSTLPGQRVVIPNQAVIRTGLRNIVFLSLGEGRFLPREVKLGIVGQNDLVEVVSGIKEGDVVVTSSQFMLDSESRLREATNKIRAQMASASVTTQQPQPPAEEKERQVEAEKQQAPEAKSPETAPKETASGIYTCPMEEHSHIVQYGPGTCPECGMELVPIEKTSGRTVFICPMPKDSVVSATPGRCPKCGMQLQEKTIGSSDR